jgi:hypothetical protein
VLEAFQDLISVAIARNVTAAASIVWIQRTPFERRRSIER